MSNQQGAKITVYWYVAHKLTTTGSTKGLLMINTHWHVDALANECRSGSRNLVRSELSGFLRSLTSSTTYKSSNVTKKAALAQN